MIDAEKVKTILEAMGGFGKDFWHTEKGRDSLVLDDEVIKFNDGDPLPIEFTDWRFVGRCMEWMTTIGWKTVDDVNRPEVHIDLMLDEVYYSKDTSVIPLTEENGTLPERILFATYEVAKRKLEVER